MSISRDRAGLAGGRGVVLGRSVRLAVLAVLTLSFLACFFQLLPVRAPMADLVRDVRAGRVSTVDVEQDNGAVVAEWRMTPFLLVRHTYAAPPPGDGIAAFENTLRQAGPGHPVRFRSFDADLGLGGAGLLMFALYPWHLAGPWLGRLTVAVGVLLLGAMAIGTRRGTSAVAWGWTAVLTGFGFYAWLWAEPAPLVAFRRGAAPVRPVRARRMAAGSLAAAATLGMLGVLVRLVAQALYG